MPLTHWPGIAMTGGRRLAGTALCVGLRYAAGARVALLLRALRPAPVPAAAQAEDLISMTLLVPARREQPVLGRALRSMLACPYPEVEVMAVVDPTDAATVAAAEAADDGSGRLQVLRDAPGRPSKGRALTAALAAVRTEVVGVFDADSVLPPGLPAQVAPLFRSGADVVQVPVRPGWDRGAGWHGVRTLLDFAAWSRANAGASTGFVRLGGTAVFFRTDTLRSVGAWRPSLTEDFDLAVRLAVAGATIVVADLPGVATTEETPHSPGGLLRQRIRWHQGFLEILAAGLWRELPTVRLRLAALGPLLVPVARVLAGLGLLAADRTARRRAAGVAVAVLALDAGVLTRLGPAYGIAVDRRLLGGLVLGAAPFYLVATVASVVAVWRELRGRRDWETTAHGTQAR
jgi:cellulose synthase/poly-beta-1,6-N-acetylglucosamine synthase-like glycosyltransferase